MELTNTVTVDKTEFNGAALRAQRKAQGLTLRQFSAVTGMSVSYLSQLERGFYLQPRPETIAKLRKGLEVTGAAV